MGALALRWNMRFSRNDYVGCQDIITGSYHGCFGHSRKVTSVIIGKHRYVPAVVFDYSYELGCRSRRKYVNKTVFIVEMNICLPHIIITPEHHIAPSGQYSTFMKVNFVKAFAGILHKRSVLSHFSKYHIYSNQPYSLNNIFAPKVLEALSKLKAVSVEIQGNRIFVWSDPVRSQIKLAQIMGRTIRIGKELQGRSCFREVS